jgi:hypothetical protein
MTNDTDETLVVFRVFKEDQGVIALFPELDAGRGNCESYMHVGQHSGADYQGLVHGHNQWDAPTRPARPGEYQELQAELESLGYKLKIRTRWNRRHR